MSKLSEYSYGGYNLIACQKVRWFSEAGILWAFKGWTGKNELDDVAEVALITLKQYDIMTITLDFMAQNLGFVTFYLCDLRPHLPFLRLSFLNCKMEVLECMILKFPFCSEAYECTKQILSECSELQKLW